MGVGLEHVKSDYLSILTDYDGFAGLHWYLGSLAPGEKKVILTVYGAFTIPRTSSYTNINVMAKKLDDAIVTAEKAYNKFIKKLNNDKRLRQLVAN